MSTINIRRLRKTIAEAEARQAKAEARIAELNAQHAEWGVEFDKRLEEMRRAQEESREETRRAQEKSREDFEQSKKEYEKRMKRLDRDMGKLGRSYGEQIEAMFVNLDEKFNALGYSFPRENEGRVQFKDENRRVLAEVDHLLENGSVMMPVEIKSKLSIDDVKEHIKRLGIIRQFNIKHNDNRKVLGAVAGGIVPENVLKYAQSRGLYVLRQNGDSVEIAEMPDTFEAREW